MWEHSDCSSRELWQGNINFFNQDPHILLVICHHINILAVSRCIVLIFISSEFIVAYTVLKSYHISDFHIRLVKVDPNKTFIFNY